MLQPSAAPSSSNDGSSAGFMSPPVYSEQTGIAPETAASSTSIPVPPIDSPEERPLTLDEPVLQTIFRDIKMIGIKLFNVVIPRGDLWGPLLICLALAVILSVEAPNDQMALAFALVFVFVWVGAFIITLNALLLGGKISFFQSICVLGYCVFPLALAALVMALIDIAVDWLWLRWLVVAVCFAWSTWASVGFMGDIVPNGRRALSVYPICLFYFVIAWLICVS